MKGIRRTHSQQLNLTIKLDLHYKNRENISITKYFPYFYSKTSVRHALVGVDALHYILMVVIGGRLNQVKPAELLAVHATDHSMYRLRQLQQIHAAGQAGATHRPESRRARRSTHLRTSRSFVGAIPDALPCFFTHGDGGVYRKSGR